MSALDFYVKVVQTLDEIRAPYMLVGAFAGLAFGLSRVTFDIDILVDLHENDFDTLAAKFPLPRYYADPEMMRNSTRLGIMFNLIDTEEGVKADLVPLTREPDYRTAFGRRLRRTFKDETGKSFDAWCAQPTDIIIGKLKAWTEGRSAKHPADIHNMLVFTFSDLSDIQINPSAITNAAALLGSDTLMLWKDLLARAEDEVKKSKNA
jgi:hypothetical protein